MGLFGRSRGSNADSDTGVEDTREEGRTDQSEDTSQSAPDGPPEAVPPRTQGPWDESDDYPEAMRADLGGLLVPQDERVKIQVQADPSSGAVSQLSLITDGSAVQIQPYAAPRTGGMWNDIRAQITSSINSAGGLVEEKSGPYGTEVRAQVATADGKAQPARFCGIDGPRWFVRLVFLGRAARDLAAAEALDSVVRGMVVVRGGDAMPMGNAIALRVPTNESIVAEDDESAVAPALERPTITLPARGPEITETR